LPIGNLSSHFEVFHFPLQTMDRALLSSAQTLHTQLAELEESIEGHVNRAQFGKTYSAALAVVAVPLLFVAPPVGIGVGVASAGVGVASLIGDLVHNKFYVQGPFKDAVEAFDRIVAQIQAQQRLAAQNKDHDAWAYGAAAKDLALAGNYAYGAGEVAVAAAASSGDDVVRMGTMFSQTLGETGGGGVQVMNGAKVSQAGSGAVGTGRVVVSTFSVTLSVVGAALSVHAAMDSLKNPASNAPLFDLVKEAKRKTAELVRIIERGL